MGVPPMSSPRRPCYEEDTAYFVSDHRMTIFSVFLAYVAFSLTFWAAVLLYRAQRAKWADRKFEIFKANVPIPRRILYATLIVLYGLPLAAALAIGLTLFHAGTALMRSIEHLFRREPENGA